MCAWPQSGVMKFVCGRGPVRAHRPWTCCGSRAGRTLCAPYRAAAQSRKRAPACDVRARAGSARAAPRARMGAGAAHRRSRMRWRRRTSSLTRASASAGKKGSAALTAFSTVTCTPSVSRQPNPNPASKHPSPRPAPSSPAAGRAVEGGPGARSMPDSLRRSEQWPARCEEGRSTRWLEDTGGPRPRRHWRAVGISPRLSTRAGSGQACGACSSCHAGWRPLGARAAAVLRRRALLRPCMRGGARPGACAAPGAAPPQPAARPRRWAAAGWGPCAGAACPPRARRTPRARAPARAPPPGTRLGCSPPAPCRPALGFSTAS